MNRLSRLAVYVACAIVIAALLSAATASRKRGRETIVAPFQSSQQTLLSFGERSHWLQPWRGYLDTVPATRLRNALGAVFNPPTGQADAVAKELAAAGFHRARVEFSWCRVSYAQPEHIINDDRIRTLLVALRDNHLRPLVLLNANEGCPGPLLNLNVRITAPAAKGAKELTVDPASAARIVPGRTGLDSTTEYKAAAFLFTSVHGDKVSLSKPLDAALAAGSYPASTLRYAPFTHPGDPRFDETMAGWLRYVGLATQEVKSIFGGDDFDVEVWNELSFGSDFLDANTYYTPALGPSGASATESALLARTVAYLRDPSHGVADIGIGDGFSNLRPWESGDTVPAGLTAIDKHPYPPRRTFPADAVFNGVRPVDALGHPDGTKDAAGNWHDAFIPHYTAFFPEYFLNAIQTESAIRDLSPLTTDVYGTPHGRDTHPDGGSPPAIWLTEAGMNPDGIPAAVLPSFHAKGALRWLTSWVNKGASSVFLYAVGSPGWGVVDLDAPGGGETLRALGGLNDTMAAGAGPVTTPRKVQLASISESRNRVQFAGDGTAAHPPLYDRDVIAFFPYQSANDRVVIATYVMTRDLMHAYQPALPDSDPRRYDMPPESFRLTITGVGGADSHVSLYDPLLGRDASRTIVQRTSDSIVLDVELTDSPRLLTLSAS